MNEGWELLRAICGLLWLCTALYNRLGLGAGFVFKALCVLLAFIDYLCCGSEPHDSALSCNPQGQPWLPMPLQTEQQSDPLHALYLW
jgi:hypothetical protein